MVDFPALDPKTLVLVRQTIDVSFHQFVNTHGQAIEHVFRPLLYFLVWIETAFQSTPWFLFLAIVALVVWIAGRSWWPVLLMITVMLLIGFLGMWTDMLATLAMVLVATSLCIFVGMPVGILMAFSKRFEAWMLPILDVLQTIPNFVYLIPVVMLLGIGKVPGLLAVCLYAVVPVIRLTNLGVRMVDPECLEAAKSFGAGPWRCLMDVQIPLALPTIFAGINQTIMMTLSMVVIAAMIGVEGLGMPVLRAITNQYLTLGIMNGMAIVGLAIVLDRTTQAYGKRLQRYQL